MCGFIVLDDIWPIYCSLVHLEKKCLILTTTSKTPNPVMAQKKWATAWSVCLIRPKHLPPFAHKRELDNIFRKISNILKNRWNDKYKKGEYQNIGIYLGMIGDMSQLRRLRASSENFGDVKFFDLHFIYTSLEKSRNVQIWSDWRGYAAFWGNHNTTI